MNTTIGPYKLKLVKDLGPVYMTTKSKTKVHMGIFQCRQCTTEYRTSTPAVREGRSSICNTCQNKNTSIRQMETITEGDVLGPHGVILLKDLGRIYQTPTAKNKERVGIFECPMCNVHYNARITYVKSGKSKGCRTCANLGNRTHGLSGTKIFDVWSSMIKRCTKPKDKYYKDYGGRGITVCKEWVSDVHAFRTWVLTQIKVESEIGKGKGKLSLDRRDVDGNYEPSNCRFVNEYVQARNTRKISRTNISGYRGIGLHVGRFRAIVSVNNKNVRLSSHLTRYAAALAYDTYVKANNLEHTTNNFLEPVVITAPTITALASVHYNVKDDYLMSGLLTRLINRSDSTFIWERLSHIPNLDLIRITLDIRALVHDHPYTYAVVESCLNGSTIINLHP